MQLNVFGVLMLDICQQGSVTLSSYQTEIILGKTVQYIGVFQIRQIALILLTAIICGMVVKVLSR